MSRLDYLEELRDKILEGKELLPCFLYQNILKLVDDEIALLRMEEN